jgi:branched-chain amino acid transport system permease protein
VALIAALYLFLTRTKFGRAVYATSINEQAGLIVGIRTERVKSFTFVIGSGLAAAAGAMTLFVMSFGPFSGLDFLITVLVVVILGGMGSIVGTLLGGTLLGVVVNVGNIFLPGALTPWLEFGLLILVLAVRPSGIMGIKGLEEI